MVHRPSNIGAFEFAVLASLRAAQLCRGCVARVDGDHTIAVMAQMEVAGGALAPHLDAAADIPAVVVGATQV